MGLRLQSEGTCTASYGTPGAVFIHGSKLLPTRRVARQLARPYVTIYLDVSAASDAGAISGVEATLSGPAMVTMSCDQRGAVTVCRWPSDIYTVTAGSYSLAVSAPGFQTANVSATVTLGTTDCGCVPATLEPSTVILDPS